MVAPREATGFADLFMALFTTATFFIITDFFILFLHDFRPACVETVSQYR